MNTLCESDPQPSDVYVNLSNYFNGVWIRLYNHHTGVLCAALLFDIYSVCATLYGKQTWTLS